MSSPNDSWKDEVVTYDPEDLDTYPSVCVDPGEVKARFGWTGGEQFTHREIEKQMLSPDLNEFSKELREAAEMFKEWVNHPEIIDSWTPAQQAWMMEQLELQIQELKKLQSGIEELLEGR